MIDWLRLGIILSSVVVSSCVTTVPNVEGCIHLLSGADCTFINTGTRRRLNEDQFAEIYLGRISFSHEDWGRLRIFIDSICARKGRCDNDLEEKLNQFSHTIAELDSKGFE